MGHHRRNFATHQFCDIWPSWRVRFSAHTEDKGGRPSLKKDYSAAIEAYTKAIHLDPKDLGARKRVAQIYSDLGRYDEAIEAHKQTIAYQTVPAYQALSHVAIGDLYFAAKRYSEAMDSYNEALRLAPRLPEAQRAADRLQAGVGRTRAQ